MDGLDVLAQSPGGQLCPCLTGDKNEARGRNRLDGGTFFLKAEQVGAQADRPVTHTIRDRAETAAYLFTQFTGCLLEYHPASDLNPPMPGNQGWPGLDTS